MRENKIVFMIPTGIEYEYSYIYETGKFRSEFDYCTLWNQFLDLAEEIQRKKNLKLKQIQLTAFMEKNKDD